VKKLTRPTYLPIETAPKDGTWILVLAGPEQNPIEVHWSPTLEGWISHEWVVQHLVTHWAPVRR